MRPMLRRHTFRCLVMPAPIARIAIQSTAAFCATPSINGATISIRRMRWVAGIIRRHRRSPSIPMACPTSGKSVTASIRTTTVSGCRSLLLAVIPIWNCTCTSSTRAYLPPSATVQKSISTAYGQGADAEVHENGGLSATSGGNGTGRNSKCPLGRLQRFDESGHCAEVRFVGDRSWFDQKCEPTAHCRRRYIRYS